MELPKLTQPLALPGTVWLTPRFFNLQLSTEAPGANEAYDSSELPNITSLAHPDLLPNTQNYHRDGGLKSPVLSPKTTYFARLVTRNGAPPSMLIAHLLLAMGLLT
jgi:hypothetical protein